MLEYREFPELDLVEVTVDGHITGAEYHAVAERALEFMDKHKNIRVLKEVRNFGGMDISVVKEKLIGGMLNHLKDIRATAVVSDEHWIEQLTNFLKPIYPFPVRCFKLSEIDQAREWLKQQ